MTTGAEVSRALLAALHGVAGLRPATPSTVPVIARVPWDYDVLALDIDVDLVEVRVVATGLPLPPLLGRAETALRAVLQGTVWAAARLRIVVTDIDRGALHTLPIDPHDSAAKDRAPTTGSRRFPLAGVYPVRHDAPTADSARLDQRRGEPVGAAKGENS